MIAPTSVHITTNVIFNDQMAASMLNPLKMKNLSKKSFVARLFEKLYFNIFFEIGKGQFSLLRDYFSLRCK